MSTLKGTTMHPQCRHIGETYLNVDFSSSAQVKIKVKFNFELFWKKNWFPLVLSKYKKEVVFYHKKRVFYYKKRKNKKQSKILFFSFFWFFIFFLCTKQCFELFFYILYGLLHENNS